MPGRHISLVVTVVRHGETDQTCHVPRILQGQSDHQMNQTGFKHARALAWRLKKHKFHRIYTSDLVRAQQTAQEIAKHHPKARLIVDPRLREQNLGDLTGLDWPTAKQILKSEDRTFEDHIGRSGENVTFFTDRIQNFYADIIEQHVVQPYIRASGDFLDPPIHDEKTVKKRTNLLGRRESSVASPMFSSPMLNTFDSVPMTPTTPSTPSLLSPAPFPHPQRQVEQHVLIVTHGGVITTLFKHLLDELQFPLAETIFKRQTGFPKNTSVYRFEIARVKTIGAQGQKDFEWEGCVTLMNDVGHLAALPVREAEEAARDREMELHELRERGLLADGGDGDVNAMRVDGVAGVKSGLIRSGSRGNLIDSPKMPRKRPFGLNAFGGKLGKEAVKVARKEESMGPPSRVKSLGW
ncbi:hypothetical protein HK097_000519 [Rhizophlyctis rosea]|uniref:Phosphoglycerate mutase-like protein n=1 Tax=Rhizophlyctis rosea TaxID=64517 RepID=A0AAD5S7Y8_9FUNG|nr:hypothetical protein HK097_000519 [Rhizophlyctis rosea]